MPKRQTTHYTMLNTLMLLLVSISGCLQENTEDSDFGVPVQDEPLPADQIEEEIPLSTTFKVCKQGKSGEHSGGYE